MYVRCSNWYINAHHTYVYNLSLNSTDRQNVIIKRGPDFQQRWHIPKHKMFTLDCGGFITLTAGEARKIDLDSYTPGTACTWVVKVINPKIF